TLSLPSATLTLVVIERIPPPPPATIIAWRSVRPHTGAGDLSIVLDPTAAGDGLSGPTVETREGGIQKVLVTFDRPATLVNPPGITVIGQTTTNVTFGPPVSYPPASVTMLYSDTMQILFNTGA